MIHLSIPKSYLFNGVEFEYGYAVGPWPLKKDGDPKKRAGRGFYKRIEEWSRMSDADRERYRVGGGHIWIKDGTE
jgi:hypothetical protein